MTKRLSMFLTGVFLCFAACTPKHCDNIDCGKPSAYSGHVDSDSVACIICEIYDDNTCERIQYSSGLMFIMPYHHIDPSDWTMVVYWNCRDRNGDPVLPGNYIAKLTYITLSDTVFDCADVAVSSIGEIPITFSSDP